MAIIMDDEGAGSKIGSALGRGFTSGFQALANMKMNEYAQRQQIKMQQQAQQENLRYQQGLQREQQQWQQQQMEGPMEQVYGEQGRALAHLPPSYGLQLLKNQQKTGINQQQRAATEQALMSQGFDPEQARQLSGDPRIAMEVMRENNKLARGSKLAKAMGGTSKDIPEGLSEQDVIDLDKHNQRERALKLQEKRYKTDTDWRKQKYYNEQAEPLIKSFRDKREGAKHVLNNALRLQELVDSGKVAQGITEWAFNNYPLASWNPETQEFILRAKEMVGETTNNMRGVPSNFKLKFNETNKPSIFVNGVVQANRINDFIEDSAKLLHGDDTLQKMISDNDYDAPKGLEQKFLKEMNKYDKSGKSYYDQLLEGRGITQEQQPGSTKMQGQQPSNAITQGPQNQGAQVGGMPEAIRAPLAIASRGVTGILGQGGNIKEMAKEAYGFPHEQLMGIATNIANALTGEKKTPKENEEGFLQLPTTGKLNEKLSELTGGANKPRSWFESKLGDFVEKVAPLAVGLPGSKTLGIAKTAPMSLTKAIPLAVSGTAARTVAERMGMSPATQNLADLLATIGTSVATEVVANKKLPRQIENEMARQSYETGKQERLGKAAQEYEPKLIQQEEAATTAQLELPKQQEAFRKDKAQRMQAKRKEKHNYQKEIESNQQIAHENYNKANEVTPGNVRGDASNVWYKIEELANQKPEGLTAEQVGKVNEIIKSAQESIKENGEMTIGSAKRIKRNINDEIFNHGKDLKPGMRDSLIETVKALDEFIKEAGGEEHYEYYKKADEATQKYKELSRDQEAFNKARTEEISDISKERFSETKAMELGQEASRTAEQFKTTQKEYDAIRNSISKETFDQFQNSPELQAQVSKPFIKVPKNNQASKYGAAGVGYILGSVGFGGKMKYVLAGAGHLLQEGVHEARVVKNIMKHHPEFAKQYGKEIFKTGLKSAEAARTINSLGSAIQNAIKQDHAKLLPRTHPRF